jgi:hypothetical protein
MPMELQKKREILPSTEQLQASLGVYSTGLFRLYCIYFKSSMKCSRLLHADNRVSSPPPTVLYRKEGNAWFVGTGLHTRVHEQVLYLLKFNWFSQAGSNLCEQEMLLYTHTYLKVTNMLKPPPIYHKQFKTGTNSG